MQTYYIISSGTINRDGDTLKFSNSNENRIIPLENIESIVISGNVSITKPAISILSKNNVSVFFMSMYDNYISSLIPEDYLLSGKVIMNQAIKAYNMDERLKIARIFVYGAARNMAIILKRGNMGTIRIPYKEIMESRGINQLMSYEGNFRNNFLNIIDKYLPEHYRIIKRSRRPPRNKMNALISFLNMLLYSIIESQIFLTHLNPSISFLHEPFERRNSLSLDVSEIFKPLICDRLAIKMVKLKIIKDSDFLEENGVFLNENGRKKVVKMFDDKLQETVYSSSLKRYVSYKYLIRLELYKIEKYILEGKKYKPYISRK